MIAFGRFTLPGGRRMAHVQNKRPFPKALFTQLTKTECEHFIEVLHFAAQSESPEDVKDVLARFQILFPFTRVIGGLAKLSRTGAFEGFTNVLTLMSTRSSRRPYRNPGLNIGKPPTSPQARTNSANLWQRRRSSV